MYSLRTLLVYSIGRMFSYYAYDKKYRLSRYFQVGQGSKMYAIGWRWAARDCMARSLLGINRGIPWPVSIGNTIVGDYNNIEFDPDDLNNFQGSGCYFQSL